MKGFWLILLFFNIEGPKDTKCMLDLHGTRIMH